MTLTVNQLKFKHSCCPIKKPFEDVKKNKRDAKYDEKQLEKKEKSDEIQDEENSYKIYTYEEYVYHLRHDCKQNTVTIACPQLCDSSLLLSKKEMIAHLENDCPNTLMTCKECGGDTKRSEINTHDVK